MHFHCLELTRSTRSTGDAQWVTLHAPRPPTADTPAQPTTAAPRPKRASAFGISASASHRAASVAAPATREISSDHVVVDPPPPAPPPAPQPHHSASPSPPPPMDTPVEASVLHSSGGNEGNAPVLTLEPSLGQLEVPAPPTWHADASLHGPSPSVSPPPPDEALPGAVAESLYDQHPQGDQGLSDEDRDVVQEFLASAFAASARGNAADAAAAGYQSAGPSVHSVLTMTSSGWRNSASGAPHGALGASPSEAPLPPALTATTAAASRPATVPPPFKASPGSLPRVLCTDASC